MKLEIKKSELGNLKEESDGTWSYYIITKNGKVRAEGFKSEQEAIKDAEKKMMFIVKVMLKKK
jgi:hypothetical protein